MHVDDRFRPNLEGFDLAHLERTRSTVYALWPDLCLGLVDDSWGATWLGRSVLEWLPAPVRRSYRGLYRQVLERGKPVGRDAPAVGPAEPRRLHLVPLDDGLLVLSREVVGDTPPLRYEAADGYVHQCCRCHATQRADAPDTWDWVPAYLDPSLDQISHGLCPVCFRHDFPDAARRRASFDPGP